MAPKKKRQQKSDEFEVERIVGDKYVGNKRLFFIKWRNFTSSNNTWEPEENLGKCSSLIREYFNSKGLRNSKSHSLSTTLLRSLRVSKQRRSSISSLISISSPKSSRKLIVSIVDANCSAKKDYLNADKQPEKSASSVLHENSPRVQLVRIDLPAFKEQGTQPTDRSGMDEYSPESDQLSDSSSLSLSIQLSDESMNDHSPEYSEVNNLLPEGSVVKMRLQKVSSGEAADWKPAKVRHFTETVSSLPDIESHSMEDYESPSTDADKTEQNFVPSNSNMAPLAEISAPPVLDEDLDEIEDSDEELLTMRTFEEFKDEENPTKRGSKKGKRRKY